MIGQSYLNRSQLAEREAGNTISTTEEEIVGVLDALLRKGEINRKQYIMPIIEHRGLQMGIGDGG